MRRLLLAAGLVMALTGAQSRAAPPQSTSQTIAASNGLGMQRTNRSVSLPDRMQGRWRDAEDPTVELLVSGGEVTCFGKAVNYDFKEVVEEDGALTVSLGVNDPDHEDAFQRENVTGLVITPEGDFHAYNVKFAANFIRVAAAP